MLFPEQDRASIEARLLDKCTNDIITGCWLWTASLTNKGYGELMLRHTKRTELAHRLAYCIFFLRADSSWRTCAPQMRRSKVHQSCASRGWVSSR